jgi:hypothetical protein
VDAGGLLTLAIITGILAALACGYLVATFLERFERPPHWPDTQDDPRAIDILKRGQICPWPTEGECRGRAKLSERGAARTGRGPGVTQQSGTIARSHKAAS